MNYIHGKKPTLVALSAHTMSKYNSSEYSVCVRLYSRPAIVQFMAKHGIQDEVIVQRPTPLLGRLANAQG